MKKKQEATGSNDQEPNLLKISKSLDEFYFLEKLVVYCNYLSYSGIMASDAIAYHYSDFKLLKEVLTILQKNNFKNPVIKIYWKIKQLFEGFENPLKKLEDDTELEECLALIEHNRLIFNEDELGEIYSFLTNYTGKRLNLGNTSYLTTVFELNNELINIKFAKGKKGKAILHSNVFRNMVILCLLIEDQAFFNKLNTSHLCPDNKHLGFQGNVEWGIKFVKSYQTYLPKKAQNKYYRYCMALIYFHQKDFLSAYKAIGDPSRMRGLYINLDLKILYLQILFEINEMEYREKKRKWPHGDIYDEIERKIESYRDIIKRDTYKDPKLSYQKQYFTIFLDLYRKLYHFDFNFRYVMSRGDLKFLKKKNELEIDIEKCPYKYKEWIKEKFEHILN